MTIGRAAAAFVLVALIAASCRTGRPSGSPVAPLAAATSAEAMEQLRDRRDAFRGIRSLMRVRATTGGKTQTFRAQLAIHDPRRMELIAYTPVGTTALTLTADGSDVRIRNHVEGSEWEGSASELARSFGFLGSSLLPAEISMLIVGLPPREGLQYDVTPSGLARAAADDLVVAFAPPSYPAQNVVVTRGGDRIEIEHLEVVSED